MNILTNVLVSFIVLGYKFLNIGFEIVVLIFHESLNYSYSHKLDHNQHFDAK